jgi:hypothetical protein
VSRPDEREPLAAAGERRLTEHAADCDECRPAPLPLAALARDLASYAVPLDVAALSRRVLAVLRPELARLASVWFWRRVSRVTLAALLPLPVILALDVYLLRLFYTWAIGLVPVAVATYLVVTYAATQILLFAATYAAIPLVLARDAWARAITPAEALT